MGLCPPLGLLTEGAGGLGGGGRNSVILMLLCAADWRSHRHFAPLLWRFRPGWRSHPRIPTQYPTQYAHYTPVPGGVKRRKDKGLGNISGFPGRIGLFDFFAAGEFQVVRIDFVGQPRISASMAAAQDWAVAAALPGAARTAPAHELGSAAKYASPGW